MGAVLLRYWAGYSATVVQGEFRVVQGGAVLCSVVRGS